MMFSNEAQKKASQRRPPARGQTGARRLYSIAAWPEQRAFAGNLSSGGTDYNFSYAPSRAEATNRLLQLTGRLTVTGVGAASGAPEGAPAQPSSMGEIALEASLGNIGQRPQMAKLRGQRYAVFPVVYSVRILAIWGIGNITAV